MKNLGTARRFGVLALIATVVTLSMTLMGSAEGSIATAARAAAPASDATTALARLQSAPTAATAASAAKFSMPVTGTVRHGGTMHGRFTFDRFRVHPHHRLVAQGTLTGTIRRHGHTRHFTKYVWSMPVRTVNGEKSYNARSTAAAAAAGTCQVLDLVLGPLDLNLLGLKVHLNQVVLNIVAQAGGGLLGDLLCAVANLLNGGPLAGLLGQLSALLNQILGQLGGL